MNAVARSMLSLPTACVIDTPAAAACACRIAIGAERVDAGIDSIPGIVIHRASRARVRDGRTRRGSP